MVVLGATICSPQEHSEQERRRLVAPPGSPIEIVERRIKSPSVLSEDGPHTRDEEHLRVARAMGVDDQSLADRRVSRLLQHQPQVEAAAHQRRAAHLVSLERASAPEVTEIVHGVLGRGRDAGTDVDEHLLRKVSERSRRRHTPPSDERKARFWSVWSMTKRG